MKVISKKEAKDANLKDYFTGIPCKNGHLSVRSVSNGICAGCRKEYRENNKDLIKQRRKKYYDKNKKNEKIRKAQWKKENPQKYYQVKRNYVIKNPFDKFTRDTLTRIEKLTKNKRKSLNKVEGLLGYTSEEFKAHIESSWEDGMSWENRSDWHIDHIKPLSLFIKEGITDITIINSLSNLRPLWAKDNLSKGKKFQRQNNQFPP